MSSGNILTLVAWATRRRSLLPASLECGRLQLAAAGGGWGDV